MQSLSALRERQRLAGAVFASDPAPPTDAGLPLHFGHPREEYAAALNGGALIDWSDHGVIELIGSDRVKFLHSFCTNDVKRLSAGQGCEAFVTNVKGRILGHVWIEADSSSLRLDVGPVPTERLVAHFERYIINEDVSVADRTQEWGELLVMGPSAARAISPVFGEVAGLGPLVHVEGDRAMGPTRVSRRDIGVQTAYVVSAPRASLGELWEMLRKSGARPAGSTAWSGLRIEAGLPIYGLDLTEDNLAQEAGRTRSAISFTKGCYLGQEPIARLDAMGHVNRELRSLRMTGDAVPPAQARVFSDAEGSTAVGSVTSAAFSFGSNSAIALALVRSSVSAPGTQVFVETGPSLSPASVFWSPGNEG
ncbi:MAG TPA: glycine cleavage T C-terminal barrel domain-containing protein [Planctomycetaceae bacterium]|jgi:folate-binding protein YgfZ|nr:glycine cleavage T C-terminal barrel domain-containing protein [Planctomycetaceae bacterium]